MLNHTFYIILLKVHHYTVPEGFHYTQLINKLLKVYSNNRTGIPRSRIWPSVFHGASRDFV